MVALVKRLVKGSPLTNQEGDDNLDALNEKVELTKSGTASPPSSPQLGFEWLDTDTGIKYTWTGSEWAELDAGQVAGVALTKGVTIEAPTAAENITLFYTPHAIEISAVTAVVKGTTPSVTFSINSSTDRSSGAPTVHVSAAVCTNTTAGLAATVAVPSVAAGSWIWLTTSAMSGTVDQFNITMTF